MLFYVCFKLASHDGSQVSMCSGLSAIEHTNSKFSKGYSTTGVVCTTCSHEFVLPEGAGQLQKGERFASVPLSCTFSAQPLLGMPMSTMLSFGARITILSQRRSPPTILCVNGPQIFASDYKNSPLTMPNVWTTRLLLGWSQSSTSLHIARSAVPTSHSTMSLEPEGEIWRARNGRGLGFRVVGVPKIKVLDFGATRWMTSSVIGIGRNSFTLVCFSYLLFLRGEC